MVRGTTYLAIATHLKRWVAIVIIGMPAAGGCALLGQVGPRASPAARVFTGYGTLRIFQGQEQLVTLEMIFEYLLTSPAPQVQAGDVNMIAILYPVFFGFYQSQRPDDDDSPIPVEFQASVAIGALPQAQKHHSRMAGA
jgi:hypothetical protein